MVIFDRLEAASDSKWGTLLPAAQVLKTFVLHSQRQPTVQDASHVLCANGGQALRLTTLVPASPRYVTVNDGNYPGTNQSGYPDWYQYRLEVNDSGAAQSYFLNVLQARDASGTNLTTSLVQDASSYQVTLTHPTLGTAIVKFQKGMVSTGGEFGYAATGTPTLAGLAGSVQGITVTDSGPVWGAVPPTRAEAADIAALSELGLEASPNPFRASVSFELRAASKDKIKTLYIYSASGKCVARLVAHRSPLTASFTWNAAGFSSGVYLAKLRVGDQSLTKRVLLMK
jgi:hypothetical protein